MRLALGILLALAVLARPSEAGEEAWAAWVGAGATEVDAVPAQFVRGALWNQGTTAIGSLGASRRVLPFLRVGLRGSYFRLQTSQTKYCRTTCIPVNDPSRIDFWPVYASVEGEWGADPGVNLHLGGGYGQVWAYRTPLDAGTPTRDRTARHRIVTAFAGVMFGERRVRGGFEVAWHRASDVRLDLAVFTPALTGVEATVRLELRR